MILFAIVARQAAISKPRASGDDPAFDVGRHYVSQ